VYTENVFLYIKALKAKVKGAMYQSTLILNTRLALRIVYIR